MATERVGAALASSYGVAPDTVVVASAEREPKDYSRLLEDFKAKHGSLKLEVGSGIRPAPGYIHLDMEHGAKKPCVEISCDFAENDLPSDSFDEIRSIHFLEHIFWMKCPWVMSEFNRILKMGGKLFIEVPDFDVAARRKAEKIHLFYETVYMNSVGDGDIGNQQDFVPGFNHCSTWNDTMLTKLAQMCGFEVKRRPDLEAKSVHSWIGVVYLECTKIGKPLRRAEANKIIGIFGGNSMWFDRYTNLYG